MLEALGAFAFIILLFHMSLPNKVKVLSRRMKRLEAKRTKKGESKMSELLKSLEGKRCKITGAEGLYSEDVTIIGVEDEWMKMETKKGIVFKRIDDISQFAIIE